MKPLRGGESILVDYMVRARALLSIKDPERYQQAELAQAERIYRAREKSLSGFGNNTLHPNLRPTTPTAQRSVLYICLQLPAASGVDSSRKATARFPGESLIV